MREVILKEGEFIRIKGKVTMSSVGPHDNGGSSWTANNPVILLGKCKHIKTRERTWFKDMFGGRVYPGKWIECVNCGVWLRESKPIKSDNP